MVVMAEMWVVIRMETTGRTMVKMIVMVDKRW